MGDIRLIQNALGIESDDVANYCFPKNWPADREQRAAIARPGTNATEIKLADVIATKCR